MKNSIDKDVVMHAAVLLMKTNNNTTSLDVKNHLRSLNFWAVQDEVSKFMNELSDEHNWVRTSNGRFNTYALSTQTSSGQTSSVQTTYSQVILDAINEAFNSFDDDLLDDTLSEDDFDMRLSDNFDLEIDDIIEIVEHLGMKLNFDSTKIALGSLGTIEDLYNMIVSKIASPAITNQSQIPVQTAVAVQTQVGTRIKVNISPVAVLQSGVDNTTSNIQSNFPANHWVLYLNTGNGRTIYDGVETRDHVRSAYARKIGVEIQKTRACRVKNLHRLDL